MATTTEIKTIGCPAGRLMELGDKIHLLDKVIYHTSLSLSNSDDLMKSKIASSIFSSVDGVVFCVLRIIDGNFITAYAENDWCQYDRETVEWKCNKIALAKLKYYELKRIVELLCDFLEVNLKDTNFPPDFKLFME